MIMRIRLFGLACVLGLVSACGTSSYSDGASASAVSGGASLGQSPSLSVADSNTQGSSGSPVTLLVDESTAYTGMRSDITAMRLVAQMAPGANLWNTLDAVCDETQGLESEVCWGNPRTTRDMISDIKAAGFKALRIPVSWYNHSGPAPDYIVDAQWMDRVEQVANYAFDHGLYVIINIHHDDLDHKKPGSWLSPTYANQQATTKRLQKLWLQIANRFKDYGDYLLFETMNEPRAVNTAYEWNGGSAEHRDVVNQLNLAAVNTIRGTGGNNTARFIMVPQVGAHGLAAIADMVIPNDDDKIIVSIHNYNPFNFTLNEGEDGVDFWGAEAQVKAVQDDLKSYHQAFVSQGRAVILGEWGAGDKNNIADRVHYYQVLVAAAKQYQITPIAWIYSYNRASRQWKHPLLEEAIFKAYQ